MSRVPRTSDLLDTAHSEAVKQHGDAWPKRWQDWLTSWADAGMGYREQAAWLHVLYGVEVSHSTVGNLHAELAGT